MMRRKSVIIAVLLLLAIFVTGVLAACDEQENPTYKVSFYNGETLISTIEVEWADEVGFPAEIPTKESDEDYDYTFKGWANTPDSTEVVSGTIRAYSDMTFYAIFTAEEREAAKIYFTVTFIDDYTGQVIGTPQQIEQGGDAVLPIPPDHSAEGYVFSGWSASNENIKRTTTIRALYNLSSVTLSRHYLGQTRSENVVSGSSISLEAPTISSAFVFEGWYWDEEFTRPVNDGDNTMPLTNADIYAKISVNFTTAAFSVTEDLVYGNANTVSITGLSGEGTIDYTYAWRGDENTVKSENNAQRILRNAGNYNLGVTITATYSYNGDVVLTDSKELTQSYEVQKATLTVSLSVPPVNVTYGEAPAVTAQFINSEFKYEDTSDLVDVNITYTRYEDDTATDGSVVDNTQKLSVGYYVVSAEAEELSNYAVSVISPVSFTVNKKDLTVGFTVKNYTYCDDLASDFALTEFSYDASELVYGEDISVIGTPVFTIEDPSYSVNYPNALNVGTYFINLSGLQSDNYNIKYSALRSSFTVDKKAAAVITTASDWTYGEDASYSYSVSGVLDNDKTLFGFKYVYTKNGLPFVYNDDSRLGAGEYTVAVNYNEASNYALDDTDSLASFTVSKAKLSSELVFTNAQNEQGAWSLTYGTVPSYNITYSGFVDNDGDSIKKEARIVYYNGMASGNAAQLDAATYSVVIEGLESLENYDFTPQSNITLTVHKKAFNIKVELKSGAENTHTYGELRTNIIGKFTYSSDSFAYSDNVTTVFGGLNLVLKDGAGTNVSANLPFAGEYTAIVEPTRSAANYDVTITGMDLVVDRAALTIDGIKTENLNYGNKPTSVLNVSGFKGTDEAKASPSLEYVDTNNVCYTNDSAKFPVGNYNLKIVWADESMLANYKWEQPDCTVEISPLELTLSFEVQDIVYGEQMEYSYSFDKSFAYGETMDDVFPEFDLTFYLSDSEYTTTQKYFEAGDYTAEISGLINSNYTVTNMQAATVSFTVEKQKFNVENTISTSRLDGWSYNPSFESDSEFTFSGTLQLNTTDVDTYVWNSENHDEQLNWVSGYSISYGSQDVSENFELIYNVSVTLKASQFIFTAPNPGSFTYDQNAHSFPVSVEGVLHEEDEGVTVTVEYSTDGTSYATTVPTFINAGEYTVYYRISAKNYDDEEGSFKVNGEKATNEIRNIQIKDDSFTYNGVTRTYDISAESKFGDLVVTLNDKVITENQDITNAGTYKFVFNVAGTDNYTGATAYYTITIDKANYTVAASNQQQTYTGSAFGEGISVTARGDDSFTVKYTVDKKEYQEAPTFTNAGEYKVSYAVSGNDNYNDVSGEYTVKINKATTNTITDIKFEDDYTLVYDGSAKDYDISAEATFGKVEVSLNGVAVTENQSITNAGTYNFAFTVAETDNYAQATAYRTVVIAKASYEVVASNQQQAYTGNSFGEGISVRAIGDDTFTVKYSVDGVESNTAPTFTNAGIYTVNYTVTGNSNYNDITSRSYTVTIDKANNAINDIKIEDTTFIYDGVARVYDISANANFGEVVVTLNNEEITENPSLTNADTYNFTFTVEDTDNYEGASIERIVTINKATKNTLTANLYGDEFIYDGTVHTYDISASADFGEVNVSYTYNGEPIEKLEIKNAGTYVITYSVDETANYVGISEQSRTIIVNRAKNELTINGVTDGESFVYTNNGKEYTVSASSLSGDTVSVTLNGVAVTGAQTVKDVGAYTFTFSVAQSNNYNEISESRVVTITKATTNNIKIKNGEAEFGGDEFIYDGTVHTYDISASADFGKVNVSYTYNGTAIENLEVKNAGTYVITYSVDATNNYVGASAQKTITVNKDKFKVSNTNQESTYNPNASFGAALKISATQEGVELDGSEYTVEYLRYQKVNTASVMSLLPLSGDYTEIEDKTKAPQFENAGTYYVYYSITDKSGNYESMEAYYTVTIAKAENVITTAFEDEVTTVEYKGGAYRFDLTATATNGNVLVTYDGREMHNAYDLRNAGEYIFTFAVNESENYNSATVTRTVKITKVDYSVSANGNQTDYVYSGEAQGKDITVQGVGSDTFTVTYTVNGQSANSLNSLKLVNAGEYTVSYAVSSDALANYNVNDAASGEFTVTIDKATRVIDTSKAAITEYTYTGATQNVSLDGITLSDTEGLIKIVSGKQAFTHVPSGGIITLTLGAEATANYYAADNVDFTVTVNKAKLTATVTLDDSSLTYGENPSASIVWSGFVGGESESVITNYDNAIKFYRGKDNYTLSTSLYDAGSYTVTAEGLESENYEINVVSASLTIAKKTFTISETHTQNYLQEWSISPSIEQPFAFAGTLKLTKNEVGTYTLTSAPNESSDFTWENGPTITYNEYDVINNFDIKYDITVILNEWQFDVTKPSKTTFDYDGNPHSASVTATPTGDNKEVKVTIEYSNDKSEYTTANLSFIDVGAYTVYYRISAEGYDTVEDSFIITINQVVNTISTDLTDFTAAYNGQSKYTLDLTGTSAQFGGDISVSYRYTDMAGNTTELSNPEFINAGAYKITLTSKADDKNYIADTKTVTVTIAQAQYNVVEDNASYTYNGSTQGAGVTVSGVNGETFSESVTYSTDYQFTNAGTHTVNYTVTGNNNYEDITDGSYTITISQAQAVITSALEQYVSEGKIEGSYKAENYEYDTTATAVLKGTQVAVAVTTTVTYTLPDQTAGEFNGSFKNAGTYVVTYKVEDNNNYKGASKQYTILIKQVAYNFTEPENNTFIYNGTLQGAPITVTDISGVPNDDIGEINIVHDYQYTNVGTYDIKFTVSGNTNYIENDNSYTYKLIINKADVTVDTSKINTVFTYSGSEQTVDLKQAVISAHESPVAYSASSGTVENGVFTFTTVAEGNGVVLTISVPASANYNEASATVTLTVNKANYVVTVNAPQDGYVYNGQQQGHGIAVTTKAAGDAYTVTYTVNGTNYGEAPTFVDAGEYTVSYTVSGNGNYNDATGEYTIVISKADIKVEASGSNTTYNGTTVEKGVAVGEPIVASEEFKVTFKVGDESEYTESVPTFTNAGVYTVHYIVEPVGNSNYNTITGTYTVTINKADVTIDTSNIDNVFTYNGEVQAVDLTQAVISAHESDINYLASKGTVENGKFSFTNVADGNGVVLTISVPASANYNEASETVTLTVNKATDNSIEASLTHDMTEVEGKYYYDANSHLYTLTSSAKYGTLTTSYGFTDIDRNAISTDVFTAFKNAGTYTIILNVAETDDYNGASKTVTVVVNKANVTINTNAITAEYTYNGSGQTVDLTKAEISAHESEIAYSAASGTVENGVFTFTNVADGNGVVLTISVPASANYNEASATVTLTVNKANYTVSNNGNQTYTYDGTAKGSDITVVGVGNDVFTVTYTGNGQSANSLNSLKLVNAGEYTVSYTVSSDAIDNYNVNNDSSGSFTINIYKATDNAIKLLNADLTEFVTINDLSYKTEGYTFTVKATATYGGEVNLTAPDGVTVTKTNENGEYTFIFSLINVNSYEFKFSVDDTANYNAANETRIISINQATNAFENIVVKNGDDVVEDGAELGFKTNGYSLTVTAKATFGEVKLKVNNSEIAADSNTNGEYTFTVELHDKGDYTFAFSVEGNTNYTNATATSTVKIGLATYTVTSDTSDVTVTYDGQNHFKAVTITDVDGNNVDVTYTYTLNGVSTQEPSFTDVGTCIVSFDVKDRDTTNYDTASGKGSYTIVINKAENAIASTTVTVGGEQKTGDTIELPYIGSAYTVSVQATATYGEDVNITYTYNGEAVTGAPTYKDVGTYVITFTVAGNNYNVQSATRTIKITKVINALAASVTVDGTEITAGANAEYPYKGDAYNVSVTASATFGDPTVNYYYTVIGGTETKLDAKPTFQNAGTYKIEIISADGGDNYSGEAKTYTVVINQATFTVSGVENIDCNYDAVAHSVTVTATDVKGNAVTMLYSTNGTNYSEAVPSFTNVTSTTVSYKVEGNNNYASASGNYTVTIKPFTLTVDTEKANQAYTYNGIAQGTGISFTNSAPDSGYNVEYSTDGSTYSIDVPTFTDVETYTVYYRISGGNYTTVTGEYKVVINKANLTVSGLPTADVVQDYSQAGYTVGEISVSGVMTADTDKVSLAVTVSKNGATATQITNNGTYKVVNKGEYTVAYTVSIDSSISGNYNVTAASGSYKVTINGIKLTLDTTDITTEFTYNGSEQSVDLSNVKIYNGNTEVTLASLASEGAMVSYSTTMGSVSESGIFSFTNVAEANGANLQINLTVSADSNYAGATATVTVKVNKAEYTDIAVPAIDEQIMMLGKTLASVELPDNYLWTTVSTALKLGTNSYAAYYNADPSNYNDYTLSIPVAARKEVVTVTYAEKIEANYGEINNSNYKEFFTVTFTGELDRGDGVYTLSADELNGKASYTVSGADYTVGSTYSVTYSLTFTENDYFELSSSSQLSLTTWFKLKSVDVNGTLYTIEDALKEASGTAIVKFNTSFASAAVKTKYNLYAANEYYTVKSGATLLVPYADSDTTGFNDTYTEGTTPTAYNASLYVTLTIPSDIILINNGTTTVGALTGIGKAGKYRQGGISGGYGKIDLSGTITSTGNINVYGEISGSGTINATAGKVRERFEVIDWAGGTSAAGVFLGNYSLASIATKLLSGGEISFAEANEFPFKQYSVNAITSKVVLSYGATYSGIVKMFTSAISAMGVNIPAQFTVADFTFVSADANNGLFALSQGATFTKTIKGGRTEMRIVGGATGGAASLNLRVLNADLVMSTKIVAFPISSNIDIVFESGAYMSSYGYKIVPGASMSLVNGASLTLSNIVKGVIVYNKSDINSSESDGVFKVGENCTLNITGKFGGNIVGAEGAKIIVDSAATTSATATEGNGALNTSGLETTYTITYTVNKTTIALNGDGSTATVVAGGKYIYQNGEWITPDVKFSISYSFGYLSNGVWTAMTEAVTNNNPSTYVISDTLTLSNASSTSEYAFLGWYNSSSCTDESRVYTINGEDIQDKSLFGLFVKIDESTNLYNISFVTNYPVDGVSISIDKAQILAENISTFDIDKYTALVTVYDYDVQKQYYFGGWYLDESYTTAFSSYADFGAASGNTNITLYAKWNAKVVLTVTVTATGTSGGLLSAGSPRIAACTVTFSSTTQNYSLSATGAGGNAFWGAGKTETIAGTYYLRPGQTYTVTKTDGNVSSGSPEGTATTSNSTISVTVSNS